MPGGHRPVVLSATLKPIYPQEKNLPPPSPHHLPSEGERERGGERRRSEIEKEEGEGGGEGGSAIRPVQARFGPPGSWPPRSTAIPQFDHSLTTVFDHGV